MCCICICVVRAYSLLLFVSLEHTQAFTPRSDVARPRVQGNITDLGIKQRIPIAFHLTTTAAFYGENAAVVCVFDLDRSDIARFRESGSLAYIVEIQSVIKCAESIKLKRPVTSLQTGQVVEIALFSGRFQFHRTN